MSQTGDNFFEQVEEVSEATEVAAVAEAEPVVEASASPVAEPVVASQSAWATEQLALLEEEEAEQGSVAQYSLNFLYLEKNIGVSIDQVFKAVRSSTDIVITLIGDFDQG